MKLPQVSIITPSYNQGRFIEDLILSVKYQDYPYIEHIVVDGGSKDSTLDILHKYSDTVRWISEPDKGFADAVNKGIRMSSGEIFAIQNSDDAYHSHDSVQKAVKAFIDNPSAGVIFGDSATINEDGKILNAVKGALRGYSFSTFLCSEFTIPQASAFIRRSALESVGGQLDPSVDMAADFELWVRIGLKFPIIYVPEILANYRVYQGQRGTSSSTTRRNCEERRRILNRFFSDPSRTKKFSYLKNHAYAGTYRKQAYQQLAMENKLEGIRCLIKSIKIHPRYFGDKTLIQALFLSFLNEKQINILWKVKHHIRRKYVQGSQVQLTCRWWKRNE